MKPLKLLFISVAFLLTSICLFYFFSLEKSKSGNAKNNTYSSSDGLENASKRIRWEFKRTCDPKSGKIPSQIRAKEITFSATLPSSDNARTFSTLPVFNWKQRGPINVGGRTRAVAIDVTDENIILAGSVSGGMWRSTNGGLSWTKVTSPVQYHGITCLVQDKRVGKTNIWYAGTGEGTGTSASGGGSFHSGNGLFKSTNGGVTWSSVSNTSTTNPMFDLYWDIIWNVALDPSATSDEVYVATYGVIYRSTNGGSGAWAVVRGSETANTFSYYTDVAVTQSGVVYAALSSEGPYKGISRSTSGTSWKSILPPNFPAKYERIVIGIAPSNQNIVYFLVHHTDSAGIATKNYKGDIEYNSFWKYTYLSGDGSGTGGIWEERSQNLPNDGSQFGNFNAQGAYDFCVKVKPDNQSVVFVGGTNLYRSTDAFSTSNNTTWIGGYKPGSILPEYDVYPNQHPDQHGVVFYPSNPTKMISHTDGGVALTNDNMAPEVSWTSLNTGYISTQFYTITLDYFTPGSNIIVGGLQDNGSWFTNNDDFSIPWYFSSKGDGSYCAITAGSEYYYLSRQEGKIGKVKLDSNGVPQSFRRIDPVGGSNYQFIAPFILDPNNQNIMYLTGGKILWRNNDLSQIQLTNEWDSIATNWSQITDSVGYGTEEKISAITVSWEPAHRLYYGTEEGRIFRMDNADTGAFNPINISSTAFPENGYVSCIAVDRKNADNLMVVFSNYNVYSLFYSADGGTTFSKCAGNLEFKADGTGNGPSCRWASIMHVGNRTLYFVATSVGVYATDTLMGTSTSWIQQGTTTIGKVVTDMLEFRESDGVVLAATHGNGVYSTVITDSLFTVNIPHFKKDNRFSINCYPNPFTTKFIIETDFNGVSDIEIKLMNETGMFVQTIYKGKNFNGKHKLTVDATALKPGIYYCQFNRGNEVLAWRNLVKVE